MAQSAQEMVTLYIAAEKELLEGKTTTFNGRTLTMEDLTEIRAGRVEWERRAVAETSKAAGKKNSPALASFN